MKHPRQGRNNSAEKFGQGPACNQHVVNVQQNLEPVPLFRELLLIRLRRFVVQSVVHSHSHLRGHPLHELHFCVRQLLRHQPAKTHRAQPSLRGRQRHNRDGTHAHRPQPAGKIRITLIVLRVRYNERLLRPPNQTGGVLIERVFRVARRFISFPSFQHMQPYGISGCVI